MRIHHYSALIVAFLLAACTGSKTAQGISDQAETPQSSIPLPTIDMHMHANKADFAGPPPLPLCPQGSEWPAALNGATWGDTLMAIISKADCENMILSPLTDEEVMTKTLAIMKQRNIYAVTSGVLTAQWKAAAPDRIVTSLYYRSNKTDPAVDSVRILFNSGHYKVFGEIAAQYRGVAPNDASLDPYWALMEELDIPVGIHIGPGPIGAPYLGWDKYRARLYSPLLLEEILVRHPRLRVCIMHAAWPMIDELLALMWAHPHVYVDISGIIADLPRPAFYNKLNRIMEVVFGKRVMYGSDQMIWPELLELTIETIESAEFLTPAQKRDILYNNAARFLQLSNEEIARHHGKP